ncbi:UDP-N-acetylmuramoyl-tripeptide--D-alanyl-D-alanine ligase [Cryobacterium sp. BB736]|uniref:UDP-N-acetylmuramoyl-tripeptide--D-alanyl-D- alanine ligase n=1 Tax=Cryobacterium sp. BB736 TaxID=2746963 RepID=UPI001873EEB8
MIALTVAELAGATDAELRLAPSAALTPDSVIDGRVVVDSRLATPGSIFIALRGETTDGHLFAETAVASGSAILIVERPLDLDVPQLVVEDGYRALASLARFAVARVREAGALQVVGITGSNGKTTTKNMVRAILETVGRTVAPPGSFNNHVGAPLSMLDITETTRFLVVEFGTSGPGEIANLVSIAMPDVAAVLKVGLAHVGGFGDIEATARAKAELVTGLGPDAVAVLNADDSRVAAMADQTSAEILFFGTTDRAAVRATDMQTTIDGTSFTLQFGELSRRVQLRIIGEHHVTNALASIAIADQLGVPVEEAITALEQLERAERWRMEVFTSPDGYTVINDAYNASPDSTAAALKTLAELTRGKHRAIAVIGEMAELGDHADEEHDRIGRLVVRLNIDQLVVVGNAARHIHNAAGLEGSWDGESVLVATQDEAYDLLRGQLLQGDVVLVKSSNSAGLRQLGDRLAGVA